MSEELVTRIGRLRLEAVLASPEPTAPAREQLDVVDGAIRVAANMAGKSSVERRAALREVRPGVTVTAQGGVAKTVRSRAQQLDTALGWAKTLTPDQREAFIVSEKFDALTDWQQELFSKAFGQVDEQEAIATDLTEYDFGTELVDVEALSDDGDDEDDAELDGLAEIDYDELFNQTGWEQA
jgi:hypothetical protein